MKLTDAQKKLLRTPRVVKIFNDEFKQEKGSETLGYATKAESWYEVHLNKRSPLFSNKSVNSIVLIHELGHIDFGHCDFPSHLIVEIYGSLCEKYEVVPQASPFELANLMMDCEINSKYLTRANLRVMQEMGYPLITRDTFELPYCKDWKEYEEEFFKKVKAEGDVIQVPQDLAPIIFDNEGEECGTQNKPESTSSEEVENPLESQSDSEVENRSWGGLSPETSENKLIPVKENVENISNFLKSIFEHQRITQVDSMRAYNRGTRGRGELIYTSRSKKIKNKVERLMIILDVSGSMELKTISAGITSIKGISEELNVETRVVLWNSQLVADYSLEDLPQKLKTGGGGIVYNCLDYAREQDFDKVVLYSDMLECGGTTIKEKKKELWLACIFTNSRYVKKVDEVRYNDCVENSDKLLLLK